MECNKEEAIRAKHIAEKKMQLKDFSSARKIVLKAQQLFPDLENIAQMLSVCEVHCAEAIKVNNQENWYGILQVDPTADENSIKKQYRRLAFLLHPDKNKFEGAEAAFKLIGEAQRVLLDKSTRSLYDVKRKVNARTGGVMPPPPGPSPSPYATAHGSSPNLQQQKNQASTFWTFCPFCTIRYQYYCSTMSRAVRCQNCSKTFIAYDMNVKTVPIHASYATNQTGVPKGNGFSAAASFKTAQPSSTMGFQGTTAPGPWSRTRVSNDLGGTSGKATIPGNQSHGDPKKEKEVKFEKVKLEKVNSKVQTTKSSGNANLRKRAKESTKNVSEDDESSFTDSSCSDEGIVDETNGSGNVNFTSKENPRRSTRQKQNVTYTEDQSEEDDDNFVSPLKRSRKDKSLNHRDLYDDSHNEVQMENKEADYPKGNKTFNCSSQANEKTDADTNEGFVDVSKGSSDSTRPDAEDFCYPDPEFYDFDKDRVQQCFEEGQVWALYDDLDGMPRFYVKIIHILQTKGDFKVEFSWFEHRSRIQNEIKWYEASLPTGCGNFHFGETEVTQNLEMFSHVISVDEDTNRKKRGFILYPKKGQIWALFKGWDIKWYLDPEKHKNFDYEIVEVLSDDGETISVASLIKLKGFVSVFARGLHSSIQCIPHSDILKFSHMIPSHIMSGKERDGVPKGSYELDPAALPLNFESKFPSAAAEDISGETKVPGMDVNNEVETSAPEEPGTYLKTRMQTSGVGTSGNNQSRSNSVCSNSKEGQFESHFPDTNASCSSVKGGLDSVHKANRCVQNDGAPHPNFLGFKSQTEFCNFESYRSLDKIRKGQIWAIYCSLDGFPRQYVLIKEVQEKVPKVVIRRLENCRSSDWQRKRHDKYLPVSCGEFMLSSDKCSMLVLDTVATFSHNVNYGPGKTKNLYNIYPLVGEVWALYRNWSTEWEESDLKRCLEYDLVEVLSFSISMVVVNLLEKKGGYKAVFAPKVSNDHSSRLEISSTELARFSHRVPSFRLTTESSGRLSGCWELDPLSLPGLSLHPGSASVKTD